MSEKQQMPNILMEEVQILRIQEGDIILLKHPGQLSCKAAELIGEVFTERVLQPLGFKNLVKIAILEDGMEVQVLRKEEKK